MNKKFSLALNKFLSALSNNRQIILGMLALGAVGFVVGFICSGDASAPTFDTSTTNSASVSATVTTCALPNYTEDELFCMAAAIYNEAGGDDCSDDTRRLVGYVILNRVNDSRYPDTIREVLEEKNQYGRFYYTGIEFVNRGVSYWESYAQDRAFRIAEEVLESRSNIPIPPTVVFQSEHKQGVSVYKHQDGLYFCHATEVN